MTIRSKDDQNSSFDVNSCKHVLDLSNKLLKHIKFVGTFKEKRFVDQLNAYRDIVTVDQSNEDFIEKLKFVKARFEKILMRKEWIGITTPQTIGAPVGFNLWVNLSYEILGTYEFKVKLVKFVDGEICLVLSTLGPYIAKKRCPDSSNTSTNSHDDTTSSDVPDLSFLKDVSRTYLNNMKSSLAEFYEKVLTFHNFKKTATFLAILLVTLLAELTYAVKYLLEYSLKVLTIISGITQNSTPIAVEIIRGATRIVLAFIHLISSLVRRAPPAPRISERDLAYALYEMQTRQRARFKPLTEAGSSVVITEL